MTQSTRDHVAALLGVARDVYGGDRSAQQLIDDLDRRLHEPLRLALAGMVKAGKSTLLNAMLGEQLAPTDAGECTRVVTWYRYSPSPSVTLHPRIGPPRRMPVRRTDDRLVLELGDLVPEEVAFLEVGWPLANLRSLILVDTPGIGSLSGDTSARAVRFLTPDDSPSAADAVVYLMRHLHPADIKFLEAFRDTAAGAWQTVCAVGVLSRADEIGSGRIDSLLSARRVAHRYEREGGLAALALAVLPVAGLVAQGAKTLREDEYSAFLHLAALAREDRERLLISADRFVAVTAVTTLDPETRAALLDRFGLFGVRLATALIRGGAATSSELSQQLIDHSGLNGLQQFVADQFETRAVALKARGILHALEGLLEQRPRPGAGPIRAGIEQISSSAHTLRELSVLAVARSDGLPLAASDAAEAQLILGAQGTAADRRLGVPADSSPRILQERVDELSRRWRRLAESPLTEHAAAEVCGDVLRSLAALDSEIRGGGGLGGRPEVVLPGGPRDGVGEDAAEQGQRDQPALDGQQRQQHFAPIAERDQLR